MNKGQGLRLQLSICQTPQLGYKYRRAPLGNLPLETLQTRSKYRIDRCVMVAFLDHKGSRRVYEMMVPDQIPDGVEGGTGSRQNVVNDAELFSVDFLCQVKAEAIIANQSCGLVEISDATYLRL
jgi:hypothetical protein